MIKLINLLKEIDIKKPVPFDPLNSNSPERLLQYLQKNYKLILTALSNKHNLEDEASITDFNNIVVDPYNFWELESEYNLDMAAPYIGGAQFALYAPENKNNCDGIYITNIPNEIWQEIASDVEYNDLPISNINGLYYDFIHC